MNADDPLPELTRRMREGADLAPAEVQRAVGALLAGQGSEASKAEFLVALRRKGETAGEIADFAGALLAYAVDPGVSASTAPGPLIDICGTGGDKLDLFNISTTAM